MADTSHRWTIPDRLTPGLGMRKAENQKDKMLKGRSKGRIPKGRLTKMPRSSGYDPIINMIK